MTDKVQFQGITVAELIEALKREDPEAQVGFAYPYGDYWDSKVVQSVRKVRVNEIEWSEYHRMFRLPSECDDAEETETSIKVVVLR
jgi:hypothetical protein